MKPDFLTMLFALLVETNGAEGSYDAKVFNSAIWLCTRVEPLLAALRCAVTSIDDPRVSETILEHLRP